MAGITPKSSATTVTVHDQGAPGAPGTPGVGAAYNPQLDNSGGVVAGDAIGPAANAGLVKHATSRQAFLGCATATAGQATNVPTQTTGLVPASVSGLGAGVEANAIIDRNGRFARASTLDGSEIFVGTVQTNGDIALGHTKNVATAPRHVLNAKTFGAVGDGPYGYAITAVSNTTPVVLTAPGHNFSTGDVVCPKTTGVAAIDGKTFTVSVSGNLVTLSGSTAGGAAATGTLYRDDTDALQRWLDAIMAVPIGSIRAYLPPGTYLISYSIEFVGDVGHSFEIEGESEGERAPRILWNGPSGFTMISTWGLNHTVFRNIKVDGGAANGNIGGSGVVLGAGAAIWLHTNQHSNAPAKTGITQGSPVAFVLFDGCTIGGVAGGLYSQLSIGDGPQSPQSMVIDKNGHKTLYRYNGQAAPTVGDNAVDTYGSSTLSVQGNTGAHSVTVADVAAARLVKDRAIIFSLSNAGQNPEPYHALITDITGNVVTFVDAPGRGDGLPFTCPIGTRVSNVYPNAVWDSTRPTPDTIVDLPAIISNEQIAAVGFHRCTWLGGGFDCFNPGEYCYALIGCYSGFNTEQFWFRDCAFGTQKMVYGSYFPYAANNTWFNHNPQYGTFSGAAMRFGANSARIDVDAIGVESDTGCGYAIWNDAGVQGGAMTVRNGEIVFDNIANPYYSAIRGTGFWDIKKVGFQPFFYATGVLPTVTSQGTRPPVVSLSGASVGIIIVITFAGARGSALFKWSSDGGATYTTGATTGAAVVLGATGVTANFAVGAYSTDNVYSNIAKRPMSIDWGLGGGQGPGHLTVEDCSFAGEMYQVAIFAGGIDVFGTSSTEPTNATHNLIVRSNSGQVLFSNWGARGQVTLKGNSGTDLLGQEITLLNAALNPESVNALGVASNGVGAAPPVFGGNVAGRPVPRGQTRTVTQVLDVDYTDSDGVLNNIYLAALQDRSIIESVIVEVTETFSSARTLVLGTQQGGYVDIFNGVLIPALGGFLCSHAQLTPVVANGTTPPAVTITGAPTAPGQVIVAITTGGVVGVAAFKWSINGGLTYETGVTTAASVVLGAASAPGRTTGITVNFSAGTYTTDNVYSSFAMNTTPIFIGSQAGSNALRMQWGSGATLTSGHLRIHITTTVLG